MIHDFMTTLEFTQTLLKKYKYNQSVDYNYKLQPRNVLKCIKCFFLIQKNKY